MVSLRTGETAAVNDVVLLSGKVKAVDSPDAGKLAVLVGERLLYVSAAETTKVDVAAAVATKKLTSDQAETGTSLVDATGLAFPVVSGRCYHFRFVLVYTSAATTTGLKLSVSIPAATSFAARADIANDVAGTNSLWTGHIAASNSAVTAAGTTNSNSLIAELIGCIVPSANGTLQLRFASEVNSSAVTLKAGSCGFLTDLGT